jgi:RNA polymerase sigma-70 factor (ECF subfamily)
VSEAASEPTSVSLLEQLREPATPSAEAAWRRFVKLYAPLLFLWARRVGAGEQDIPDLVGEVFLVLAREMPAFRHDPNRCFRAWLWTVLRNKWLDRARQLAAQPALASLGALETLVSPDKVEPFTQEEYRGYLVARAVELMQAELPDVEWRACHEYLVKGRPAIKVAAELGVSVNQVYLAKARAWRRLRAELQGLLD